MSDPTNPNDTLTTRLSNLPPHLVPLLNDIASTISDNANDGYMMFSQRYRIALALLDGPLAFVTTVPPTLRRPRPVHRPTTPCCDCGNTDGTPWAEDPAWPQCTNCAHVCAHLASSFVWDPR